MADGNVRNLVAQRFPVFLWMLDHPELGPLLTQAVGEEWAPETLDARLRGSQWWQQTSEAVRKRIALEQSDPATAQRQQDRLVEQLAGWAQELGVADVGLERLADVAGKSLRGGWSEQQTRTALAAVVAPNGNGAAALDVRRLARSYMVDLDEQSLADYTRRVFTGELTAQGMQALLAEQSKSRFPSIAKLIDQGVNPGDYFGQHAALIAKMTDQPTSAIDLVTDPTWMKVISTADGAGVRPMTLAETRSYVRTTSRYAQSATGRAEMADFTTGLERMLGVRK